MVGVAAVHGNELTRLFVKPGLQGQGIGSKLLLAAEETARANGFKEITVRVLFSDAIGFYERHGMKEFASEIKSDGAFKGFEVKLMKKNVMAIL
jgi:GNAT superfamily N-acetyltransferase